MSADQYDLALDQLKRGAAPPPSPVKYRRRGAAPAPAPEPEPSARRFALPGSPVPSSSSLLSSSPEPLQTVGQMLSPSSPAPAGDAYDSALDDLKKSVAPPSTQGGDKYDAALDQLHTSAHQPPISFDEDVDFSDEAAERGNAHPYVPVKLDVSDEDTRLVAPSSWGRRAIFKVAKDRSIPEEFTRDWLDHQQVNGRLKTYDLQSRSPFGDTNELLKATGYDPDTKSLTLHVEAGMVDQLERDYEESKGYFRKIKDVVEDPNAKPGAVAYQIAAPVVGGVAHGVDVVTRPLQAASVGIAGASRALDPSGIVGLSEEYANGKRSNPLETLEGIPGAMLTKLKTGETTPGYETPLTAVTENLAGPAMDRFNPNLRPLVHAATEIAGDPLTYAPFALKGVRSAAEIGEAASKGSALKALSEVPLHDEQAVSAAYEQAAKAGLSETEIRAALAGENVAPEAAAIASASSASSSAGAGQTIQDALNIPRTVKHAFSLTAPTRQALVLSVTHPGKAARAFSMMLRAYGSQEYADTVLADIKASPFAPLREEAGLFLSEPHGAIAGREETVASNLAGILPGVKAGQRAQVVYLNKIRADLFDSVAALHPEYTPEDLKGIATFINYASGRGSLGAMEKAAPALANAFFSPRLTVARFQTAASPLTLNTPVAKAYAARHLVQAVGTGIGVLALAKASGADVELRPTSSDFGKIQIGRTRVDLFGGYLQVARPIAQLLSGKRLNVGNGQTVPVSRTQVVSNAVRSRLSPQAGFVVDLATGKTMTGEKATKSQLAKDLFLPISWDEIHQAVKEDRADGHSGLKGALTATPAFFGVGVHTYSAPKPATTKQLDFISILSSMTGENVSTKNLSEAEASKEIERLKVKAKLK